MRINNKITTKIILITATLLLLQLSIGISQEEITCVGADLTINSTMGGEVVEPGEGTFSYNEGETVDLKAQAYQRKFIKNETKASGDIYSWDDPWVKDYYNKTDYDGPVDVSGAQELNLTAEYLLYPREKDSIDDKAWVSMYVDGNEVFNHVRTGEEGIWKGINGTTVNISEKDEVDVTMEMGADAHDGKVEVEVYWGMHDPHRSVYYRFDEWTGDVENIDDPESSETTIKMEDDYEITANFEEIKLDDIEVITQPQLEYGLGDSLNLSNMEIEEKYTDGTTEIVNFGDSTWDQNYIAEPPHGTVLNGSHHNKAITVTQKPQNISTETNPLKLKHELIIDAEEGGTTDPEPGNYTYEHEEEVKIEATPDEGWYFEEWTGDKESEDEQITVTMDEDKEVTAHFTKGEYELTIEIEGEGEELEYGEGTHVFEYDEEVELEAEPSKAWEFKEWTGYEETDDETITFNMPAKNITQTAHFEQIEGPYFSIDIFEPEDEEEFEEGDEILVKYTIENIGTEPGNQQIRFKVNDKLERLGQVELDTGEIQKYYFNWTAEKGEHELKVQSKDDEDTVNVEVTIIPPRAELINPEHGAKNVSTNPVLRVHITHPEDKLTNVTFRDFKAQETLKRFEDIENGTTVPYKWEDLDLETDYRWYVRLESGEATTLEGIWNFTTRKHPEGPVPAGVSVSAGADREAKVGEPITLRGTASSHRSRIVKYKWDFTGDGEWDYESTETGIAQTTYTDPGIYRPKLKAIDANNKTNHDTAEIRVMEEMILVPRELTRESLDTVRRNDVTVSPIHEYDPEENKTTVKYSFRNQLEQDRNIRIKIEIPTKVTDTIDDLRIRPSPDKEELKNIVTWDTSLSSRELTEIRIQKEGYIPVGHVEEIQIDIRDIDVEEPEPTPTEPTTLAGMVTGALASPAAGLTALTVLIILGLGYYKREDMKQRLMENLSK